jgi:hypothetical protein
MAIRLSPPRKVCRSHDHARRITPAGWQEVDLEGGERDQLLQVLDQADLNKSSTNRI